MILFGFVLSVELISFKFLICAIGISEVLEGFIVRIKNGNILIINNS